MPDETGAPEAKYQLELGWETLQPSLPQPTLLYCMKGYLVYRSSNIVGQRERREGQRRKGKSVRKNGNDDKKIDRLFRNNNYCSRLFEVSHQADRPSTNSPEANSGKFNMATNDIAAYLDTFEVVPTASGWDPAQWILYLRGSLAGAGLMAISSLTAAQQDSYRTVKETLLAVYQVSNS